MDIVRGKLPRGEKAGHAGTLDPFAEGVLVVCVGPATRLADYVQAQPKRYAAEVTLGATSTTDDPTGRIAPVTPAVEPSADGVRQVLGRFVGHIQQAPPAHSAVHVNGKRAYELARAGADVQLAARPVVVHSIDVRTYQFPLLQLEVLCGSGTYVRALARDIGAALGCGGYCSRLTRTAVGAFTIDQAVGPDQLNPARDLRPPVQALGAMARITVNEGAAERLRRGQAVELRVEQLSSGGAGRPRGDEVAVLDEQGRLVAIGLVDRASATLRGTKVFPAE